MITEFLNMMATVKGASPNTLTSYAHDLHEADEFLSKHLEKASSDELRAYLNDCVKRDLSARTQARRISSLRRYFRFLNLEHIRPDNPAKGLDFPKLGRSLPKDLSTDTITCLINSCDQTPHGRRLRAMIEILYASGLRVSELISLKTTSLIQENNALHITGKGNKDRIVPLHPIAQDALLNYLEIRENFLPKTGKTDFLFPSKKGQLKITRDGFFKMLKKQALLCGLDADKISPHTFRHSFASHLLKGGADLRTVQNLLGHEDVSTTEIYTHILDDELKKDVFTKHPLAKKKF